MTYNEALNKAKQNFVIKRDTEGWEAKFIVYQSKATPICLCAINALKQLGKHSVTVDEQLWELVWSSEDNSLIAKVYIPPDEDINADDWIYADSVDVCIRDDLVKFDGTVCNMRG